MKFDDWIQTLSPIFNIRGFTAAYGAALAGPGVGQGEFRHGAALMDGARVVSAGFNSYKTHPLLADKTEFPYLHAEQHAMFKYGLDNCTGLELFVLRVGKQGDIYMSRPCDVCQHFIKEAGLSRVNWSENSRAWYIVYE